MQLKIVALANLGGHLRPAPLNLTCVHLERPEWKGAPNCRDLIYQPPNALSPVEPEFPDGH